jgi:diguanylate cyclase (GGDEF)-like protein
VSGLPDREWEAARQAAVEATGLLDTADEQGFNDLVRLATLVCNAPVATFTLIDRQRQWFKARHGMASRETPRRESLCALAIRAPSRMLVVRDIHADAELAMRPVDADGTPLRFYAGMPLVDAEGHALGALAVYDHAPRELDAAEQEGLEALARQAERLLELHRLGSRQRDLLSQGGNVARQLEYERAEWQRRHDDLRREASRDALTGLVNRAELERLRKDPAALARLQASHYAIAVIDIDHFKQVNDRHGHLLGDQALRAVAGVITSCVRQEDVAGRYGGEEFLLILPGTSLPGACEVAERIRVAVGRLGLPFRLTVSVGVAAGDPARDHPESVFERADQALYRAKALGRDRVVVADDRRG